MDEPDKGRRYLPEAVADYQIRVDYVNTDSWFAKHEDWNEFFNVMDVCMVWGSNARAGAYEKMPFKSGYDVVGFKPTMRMLPSLSIFKPSPTLSSPTMRCWLLFASLIAHRR